MKILISEDMNQIRKGIVGLTKKFGDSTNEIFEASDGQDGLCLYHKHKPDIVITDIKMPNMDGLELIETIYKENDEVQFIIITGYGEFDYAKQALDLGVAGFVLKPINQIKFQEVLHKAIKIYQNKKHVKEIIKDNINLENRKQLNESKRKVFASLIGKADYSIDKGEYFYQLIYVNLGKSIDDYKVRFDIINNILNLSDVSSQSIVVENFINPKEIFIVLFNESSTKLNVDTKILSNQIIADKEFEKTYLTSSDINKFVSSTMYREVKDKMVEEIFSNKMHNEETLGHDYLKEHLKIIKENILMEDYDKTREEIKYLFQSDYTSKDPQIRIKVLFNIISVQIFECFSVENNDNVETQLFDYDSIFDTFQTKEEVENKLLDLLGQLINDRQSEYSHKEYLASIKAYIDNNFTEEITVNMLSSLANISSSRLSATFKEKYGKSPYRYITWLRMQLACELLKNTGQHINLIAKTVGYEDVQHFYRVFKKEVGKTPLKFRQD